MNNMLFIGCYPEISKDCGHKKTQTCCAFLLVVGKYYSDTSSPVGVILAA